MIVILLALVSKFVVSAVFSATCVDDDDTYVLVQISLESSMVVPTQRCCYYHDFLCLGEMRFMSYLMLGDVSQA